MKKILLLSLLGLSTSVFANGAAAELVSAREQVVTQYIQALANHDAAAISQLFSNDGSVISTSKGKVAARKFFNDFLPIISAAHTEVHNLFASSYVNGVVAARFHFDYTIDGVTDEGEYIDEFIFNPDSTQLKAVYMFENLHFN